MHFVYKKVLYSYIKSYRVITKYCEFIFVQQFYKYLKFLKGWKHFKIQKERIWNKSSTKSSSG